MAGLLGDAGWGDPRSQGNGFLALAHAIAPRNRFVGGLLEHGQNVAQAQDRDMRRGLLGMQMEQGQMALESARRQREFLAGLPEPAQGGGSPANPAAGMLLQGVRAGAVPFGD